MRTALPSKIYDDLTFPCLANRLDFHAKTFFHLLLLILLDLHNFNMSLSVTLGLCCISYFVHVSVMLLSQLDTPFPQFLFSSFKIMNATRGNIKWNLRRLRHKHTLVSVVPNSLLPVVQLPCHW